jgi:hypothetical protein
MNKTQRFACVALLGLVSHGAFAAAIGDACTTIGEYAQGGSTVLLCDPTGHLQNVRKLAHVVVQIGYADTSQDPHPFRRTLLTGDGTVGQSLNMSLQQTGNVDPDAQHFEALAVLCTVVSAKESQARVALVLTGQDNGQPWRDRVDAVVPMGVNTIVTQRGNVGITVRVDPQAQ